jgi:rubredoxin
LAVVKDSLFHNHKELKAPALVFVYPTEGPYRIYAGPAGVEVLVLNFPRPQPRPEGVAKSLQTPTGFRRWQCALCSFIYDEAAGMPAEGIPPSTRWQDVPETWTCPDCSASKGDFQMVTLEN